MLGLLLLAISPAPPLDSGRVPAECVSPISLIRRHLESDYQPPLADCGRFPPREHCVQAHAWWRARAAWCQSRAVIDLAYSWEWTDAAVHAAYVADAWDTLTQAQCPGYLPIARRNCLARLRAQIGEAAYYAGQMPGW